MATTTTNNQTNTNTNTSTIGTGNNNTGTVVGLLNNTNTSKAEHGRTIWNEEVVTANGSCPIRKTVIDRLVLEAGLTKAGAATYYQNMKKKAGFVVSK